MFVVKWEWFNLVVICMVKLYFDNVVWVCGVFGVVCVKLLFKLMKILVLLCFMVWMVWIVLWFFFCGIIKLNLFFSVLSNVLGGILLIFMVLLFWMLLWFWIGDRLVLGLLILFCNSCIFMIFWIVVIECLCCVIFIV